MRHVAYGALAGVLMSALVLSLCVGVAGCTATQAAEFKAEASVLVSDVDTGSTLLIGAVTWLQTSMSTDPAAWAKVGAIASNLATKAGVSAADQAALKAEATPANAAALLAVATKIKAGANALGGGK